MVLSHFKSNMPTRMVPAYFTAVGERPGTTDRSNMNTSRMGETPGPGTYVLPSDFGHIETGNETAREAREKKRGSTATALMSPRRAIPMARLQMSHMEVKKKINKNSDLGGKSSTTAAQTIAYPRS